MLAGLSGLSGLSGLAGLAGLHACARRPDAPLTVFAAASLTDVLAELAGKFAEQGGPPVRTVFAGSGELARQVQAGAPADLVILADTLWMDRLESQGSIQEASRTVLLTNTLVVIAPSDRAASPFEWAGRIAIGDPESVPAGRYARQMLTALGVWDRTGPQRVTASDVRAVRAFVARGEVDLGVVYRSDATAFDAVRVVSVPPAWAQPDIVYPAALTRTARAGSGELMAYLRSPGAAAVFARYGFGPGR